MLKKTLSILLSLCLMFGVFTILPFSAIAQETKIANTGYNLLSESEFASKINELKGMYPEKSSPDYTYYENGTAWAWTCKGFANKLAYYCFGCSQYTSNGGFSQSWDSSSFNAGDIVSVYSNGNYDGHTIFITYVNGNTIRYAEGNHDNARTGYYSAVRWDVEISLSDLQSRFCFKHHLNGNNLTGGGAKTGLDYGDEFYAYICTRNSALYVGQTDSNNAELVGAGAQENYTFHFTKVNSNNGYRIRSATTNRYLDVDGGTDANGTNAWFCPYNDHPAQVWYMQARGEWVSITAGCTSRVLDIHNIVFQAGTNIQMWDWNGTEAQQFNIWKIGDNKKAGLNYGEDFYAMIKNDGSMKPIGRVDIGKTDTENIELMTESKNNYDRTIWHFTRLNGLNAYRISNLTDNLFMDVDGAKDADGTNIQVYKYHDHPAQEWYLQTRKGALALTAGCVKRYLDVTGASTADGANLELWEYHGTNDAQKFSLEIIDSTSVINYAISTNKSKYDLGDSVTATISGTLPYVYNYKFHIVKPDGTKEVIDNQCNSVLNYKPSADGVYTIFAEVKNPIYTYTGSVSNKAVSFRVGEEPTEPPTEAVTRYLGDVDGSSVIDASDPAFLLRTLVHYEVPASVQENMMNGDVDSNGKLEAPDATFIQRFLVHYETPYKIGKPIG